jgi:hypothetical protein
MQQAKWPVSYLLAICLPLAGCSPKAPGADARARLTTVLRDSVGEGVKPNVSFLADGGRPESHLYVTLDADAEPSESDSLFVRRARDLARFAVRHYERAGNLDSVTVALQEFWQPGVWRVVHSRAFAIASLKEPSAP